MRNEHEISPDTNLVNLFNAAYLAHKAVIKAVKNGTGVGRHSALLHSAAAQALQQGQTDVQPLVRTWDRFLQIRGPVVYVTGFDQSPGVLNGIGNLYTDDQLACWYSSCSVSKVKDLRVSM